MNIMVEKGIDDFPTIHLGQFPQYLRSYHYHVFKDQCYHYHVYKDQCPASIVQLNSRDASSLAVPLKRVKDCGTTTSP